jgi:hypothetical protein
MASDEEKTVEKWHDWIIDTLTAIRKDIIENNEE